MKKRHGKFAFTTVVIGLAAVVATAVAVIGWIFVPLAVLFGLGAELIARKEFYVAARRQEML